MPLARRYVVTVAGRQRLVEIDDAGVRVDGRALALSALTPPSAQGLWLRLGSRVLGVELSASGAERQAQIGGVGVPVKVEEEGRFLLARARAAGAPADGVERVVAPMPGRVVKCLVRAGDGVRPGQGLLVVEAMKMENELRASHAGTVTEVVVREGQAVEAGERLVEIAPASSTP